MAYKTADDEKKAFETHYNYISCLSFLIANTILTSQKNLKPTDLPDLHTKENLIKLTKKSLNDEWNIVGIDEDYSYASTSWLPIKTYYLLFNQMLTIGYIFNPQKKVFELGHRTCCDWFTKLLEDQIISFNQPTLNQVFDSNILTYREVSGSNLSLKTDTDRLYKMALRKVANYKLEEWKRTKNIDYRTKKGKEKRKEYLKNFRISVFEFPYYMRIRSNYRDFAFIDGVTPVETKRYFNCYYDFTVGLSKALTSLEKKLLKMRLTAI